MTLCFLMFFNYTFRVDRLILCGKAINSQRFALLNTISNAFSSRMQNIFFFWICLRFILILIIMHYIWRSCLRSHYFSFFRCRSLVRCERKMKMLPPFWFSKWLLLWHTNLHRWKKIHQNESKLLYVNMRMIENLGIERKEWKKEFD